MLLGIHTRTALAAGLLAGCATLLAPSLTKGHAADLAAAAPSTAPAKPRPGYVVFFEPGRPEISSVAADTIHLAARAAQSSKAPLIRIVGRADHAEAVKAELVRQGVQASAIVFVGRDDSPIVRASAGVAEPLTRRVLIAF